ncbi:hypothetical protein DPMN_059160 [Dreissena polymorpha]|uniref:Uncharacterized protein n=1 Tax=Dreissena polymorpha TaxID=45954 RepID=A0A9D4C3H3_DREPO|nr:hypothetical protein DPMN_059160 [Dreissena polymorpha]
MKRVGSGSRTRTGEKTNQTKCAHLFIRFWHQAFDILVSSEKFVKLSIGDDKGFCPS